MDDDLNTAEALGVIFEFIREANQLFESSKDADAAAEVLTALDNVLEVLGLLPKEDKIPERVEELVKKRQEARAARDYAAADGIRDQILSLGYTLKDTPDGVKISKT